MLKIKIARHVLTQHLEIFPDEMIIEPFCAEPITIRDGDFFLLCRDGLTDTLSDSDILKIVISNKELEEKTSMLFSRWSDWLDWSDTPVSKTDENEVETKLVYRYKSK